MISTVSLDRFTESKELVKIMTRFLALERLTHQIRLLVLVPYCCTSAPIFSLSPSCSQPEFHGRIKHMWKMSWVTGLLSLPEGTQLFFTYNGFIKANWKPASLPWPPFVPRTQELPGSFGVNWDQKMTGLMQVILTYVSGPSHLFSVLLFSNIYSD